MTNPCRSSKHSIQGGSVQPRHELGLEKQQGNVGKWFIGLRGLSSPGEPGEQSSPALLSRRRLRSHPAGFPRLEPCPWPADEPKEPPNGSWLLFLKSTGVRPRAGRWLDRHSNLHFLPWPANSQVGQWGEISHSGYTPHNDNFALTYTHTAVHTNKSTFTSHS